MMPSVKVLTFQRGEWVSENSSQDRFVSPCYLPQHGKIKSSALFLHTCSSLIYLHHYSSTSLFTSRSQIHHYTTSHLPNLPIFSPTFLTMHTLPALAEAGTPSSAPKPSTTFRTSTLPIATPLPSARLNSPVVTNPMRSSSPGTKGWSSVDASLVPG